jgi:ribose 5-phosphate isomerase A
MVAYVSNQVVIVVDDTKLVSKLGQKGPLPVEVVPFGHERTGRHLGSLGCRAELRGGLEPFVTDNGNLIFHCHFDRIDDPYELELQLKQIPGVVESGLFLRTATKIVVANERGIDVKER